MTKPARHVLKRAGCKIEVKFQLKTGARLFPSTHPHKKQIDLCVSGKGSTPRSSRVTSRSVQVSESSSKSAIRLVPNIR